MDSEFVGSHTETAGSLPQLCKAVMCQLLSLATASELLIWGSSQPWFPGYGSYLVFASYLYDFPYSICATDARTQVSLPWTPIGWIINCWCNCTSGLLNCFLSLSSHNSIILTIKDNLILTLVWKNKCASIARRSIKKNNSKGNWLYQTLKSAIKPLYLKQLDTGTWLGKQTSGIE